MPFRPKNSKNWHYDFQIKGCRFHSSCGTQDFEEAKAIEAQARFEVKSGVASRVDFTISEAIGTYYRDICEPQVSARTSKSQGAMILDVIKPNTLIGNLKNSDITRFVAIRRATVSNATVNRHLQFLGRALRYMAEFYEADIPDLKLKAAETKEPKERVRELTWREQDRLFQELRTDLHPLAKFALMTGARRSTITGLLWSDVDLDAGRMQFRLKGGDSMSFPINRELRAMLGSLPRSNVIEYRRYVFTFVDQLTAERRKVAGGGKVVADFKAAVIKAEIVDFRFHDLRHTFATRMLRQTGNLKLVSRLLGHKTLESTMRYAHVLDEDLRLAMEDYSGLKAPESRRNSRNLA